MGGGDEAKRRKIKQLRALADSTTFPAEAASARAKADKLERELGPPMDHAGDAFAYMNAVRQGQATRPPYSEYTLNEDLIREMRRRMEETLWAQAFAGKSGL